MIRFILFIIFAFALDLWAACRSSASSYEILDLSYVGCHYGTTCVANGYGNNLCSDVKQCQQTISSCPNPYVSRGKYNIPTDFRRPSECSATSSGCTASGGSGSRCFYKLQCDTQAEADSLKCVLNPDAAGCEDRCAVYRQQCDQLGGVFSGRQTPTGCAASCNTCGNSANKNIMEIKARSCCNQGLAPSVDNMCYTSDVATGDGMQVSTNANLDCVDPNLDDENLNLYVEYCEDEEIISSSSVSPGSSSGVSSGGGGSSEEGSSGGENGNPEQIDYYPILDSIRDTLNYIKHDVHTISTCLLTPGACAGLDNQIDINVPSDSNFIKQVNTTLGVQTVLLDSSLKNGNERIRNSIANANDTLIDSLRKFLGALSFGFSGDTLGDSLSAIHGALVDLIGQFTPGTVDTGNIGYANTWVFEGEHMSDSIALAIGWVDMDTVIVDSVFSRASWNNSGVDSINNFVNDTLSGILDSLHLQLKHENDSLKNSLSDSLTVWADSMIKVSPFASFDSLIYSTIGAKIPNTDECPEDCQSWTLSLPRFGLVNYTVDFGLCLGRVPLGGLNVLSFLKLVVRLVIVWTCISIVMWTFSHRKM